MAKRYIQRNSISFHGVCRMIEKIKSCFERLQRLNIVPTLDNMEILVQTLYDLRDIYNSIKDGDDSGGRSESDSQ